MSAIWGVVSFAKTIPTNIESLMSAHYEAKCRIERFSHASKSASAGYCQMGCGIQYITTESELEALPIDDETNGILFNADCLLDNRNELIHLLNADKSTPDGSLMYLAYRKWGIDCVKHFRGLFSIAVWDGKEQKLYLAADQLSTRCLYYFHTGSEIYFSTLLEPIRKVVPEIPINEYYIKDYLTAPGLMPNIAGDETPYQGIYKMTPGTYLAITVDGVEKTSYWTPEDDTNCKIPGKPNAISQTFFEQYQSCVSDALRTSGKVGLAMSSGLDSATVGVLAATQLAQNNQELMTYTYVPFLKPTLPAARNNELDETKPTRDIQAMYPNMVPHFLNNNGHNCMESLDESIEIMEIPFKAYVNLPNLREIYENAAKDGCKILLTGQCGNSTVSHGYIDDVLYDLYEHRHYFTFLRFLNRYSKTVKESRKQALKGCLGYFKYAKEQYRSDSFEYNPTNRFLNDKILDDYPLEERYKANGNTLFVRVPTSKAFYDFGLYKSAIYTYLGELETKMGLHYGIIIRDATKDMRIMQFCRHLPYKYYAWNGTPRWLIRSSFQNLLPGHLLNDWMRYCVQNADYTARIERDFCSVFPNIRSFITAATSSLDYLKKNEIENALNQMAETGKIRDSLEFDDLCYLYIIFKLLHMPA